jgi:hypothetical protein
MVSLRLQCTQAPVCQDGLHGIRLEVFREQLEPDTGTGKLLIAIFRRSYLEQEGALHLESAADDARNAVIWARLGDHSFTTGDIHTLFCPSTLT